MEENNDYTIDEGTLTVFSFGNINSSFSTQQVFDRITSSFIALKAKVQENMRNEAEEREIRSLEHQYIDFDKDPNETRLPSSTLQLPRLLAYTPSSYKTKWQIFAESKGIKKKKRSRMIYNEEKKDWMPRWGAGSSKQIKNDLDIIREVKAGDDPTEDPFKRDKAKQKITKGKQEIREMRNKIRKEGFELKHKNSKKGELAGRNNSKKEKLGRSIENVTKSTMTMGRVNSEGNPVIEIKTKPSKGKREGPKSDLDERKRQREIMQRIL